VAEDLTIRYGEFTAVDGVDLSVDSGELVALLGPNGAGKTTTVETLEGYRRPDSGQVRVLGLDPGREHRRLVPQIGVMLQEGGVYPAIRPIEVLRLFASYYDDPLDADELLEQVGLGERRRATWRSLSGGEKQRLSLALALIGRPAVAFLDEPTAGVDVQGRQVIQGIIRALRDRGAAVLLTTHDLEDVERLADRVTIIDRGRVVAAGTPTELAAGSPDDAILFGAPPGLDVAALGASIGAPVVEASAGEYRVEAPSDPSRIAALTAWLAAHDVAVRDIRAGRKRLEDVFLRLTSEEGDEGEGSRA
jgi:ABC-2 type transport system ATP-binding protein